MQCELTATRDPPTEPKLAAESRFPALDTGARRILGALTLLAILDVALMLVLLRSNSADDPWDFYSGAADLTLLCLVRELILLLAWLAGVSSFTCEPGKQTGDLEEGNYAPLETAAVSKPTAASKTRRPLKHASLVLLFSVSTAAQVYVGAKCVGFAFGPREVWMGPLMGCGVVFINLEAWLVKLLVDQQTSDHGELYPSLHEHGLLLQQELSKRKCNMCSKWIQGKTREAWVCSRGCPFTACPDCISRLSSDEKQVRSDSGAKREEAVSNKSYFIKALSFARPHWLLFVLAFGSLTLSTGCSMVLPAVQGNILDSIIVHDRDSFRFYVECMVVLSVAVGLFGGLRGLFFSLATRRMAVSVRNSLFRKIVSQDTAFFDGTTVGDLTSRLNGDVQAMVSPCQKSLQSLLTNSLTLLGGLAMCFWTSWRLSMLAFSAICPIIFLTETYAKWSSEVNKQIRTDLGDASNVAVEALSNIRTVKMFSTEELEQEKYESWTLSALSKSVKDAIGGACTAGLNNYLDLGASVIILLCGGSMAMSGEHVTVGDLITFQLYWARMQNAIKGLNDILMSFTRAAGAAQRVLAVMNNEPDISVCDGEDIPDIHGDVEFSEVKFAYQLRPQHPVLDGLDLSIKQGQVTAMVGPSGGGKSTVLHLLMRLYDPSMGSITLDGRELSSLKLSDVHSQVCLVSQDPQLFGGSILENITYGIVPAPPLEEVVQAAELAHAHQFITQMENSYDTRVGERGVRLSGGQRQRIAIARVLLRRPKLILLDEATSALDVESEALVQAAVDKLMSMSGTTVLVVAHRLSTVVNADQIAVLEAGKAVEVGTHTELLAAGGVYARLVAKQLIQAQTPKQTTNLGVVLDASISKPKVEPACA